MARPDLTSPEARAAYRRELAGVGRPFRWIGLALVGAGIVIVLLVPHVAGQIIGWTFVAFGWLQVLMGVAIRRAFHARRMADDEKV